MIPASAPRLALTEREQQVVELVALGHTSREAAAQLGVSPKTVEAHRTHAMNKLGIQRRVELVRYALREGYLTADAADSVSPTTS